MSTESRKQKQLIYGAAFFVPLVVIAALAVYFAIPKAAPTCFDNKRNQGETGVDCGGPCIHCDIKALPAPTVRFEKVFKNGNRALFAAEIENLNVEYGAKDLPYTVTVRGADGETLQTIHGRTFIYALDRRYIVELLSANSKEVADVEFSLSASSLISWESRDIFRKPDVSERSVITAGGAGGRGSIVSGILTNRNPFTLSNAEVVGFIYTAQGMQIGASKTQMENMASFEEREFVLNFPAEQIAIDPSKTKIFVYSIR